MREKPSIKRLEELQHVSSAGEEEKNTIHQQGGSVSREDRSGTCTVEGEKRMTVMSG